jgi:fructokinase
MVYALGEILLDIIFKKNGDTHAIPGGAMLNAAVSMAKKGTDVTLISEIGNDNTGNLIVSFLKENKIGTSLIHRYDTNNTSLALAFLDAQGKPDYTFYKTYPEQRILNKDLSFNEDDLFVFASFYSVDPAIRQDVLELIRKAKDNGILTIYDPNIRHKRHLTDPRVLGSIRENLSLAGWIKGSDEDFTNIFGQGDADRWISEMRKLNPDAPVIITFGEKGSRLYLKDLKLEQPARTVRVASTVGAGDAFSAGMIHGFLQTGKSVNNLTLSDWKTIMETATGLSAEVCGLNRNFIL